MLGIGDDAALLPDLLGAALDVGGDVGGVLGLVGAGDDPGRVGEEVVHLLERQLLGLGQQQVEEHRVGEVAYHEQQEVPPPDRVDRDLRHLPDHRVERVARHRRDRHALAARMRVENLGGDDPNKRAFLLVFLSHLCFSLCTLSLISGQCKGVYLPRQRSTGEGERDVEEPGTRVSN